MTEQRLTIQEAEEPNVVYGRLLESAHFTAHGFERACSELEWLLDEGRWREVGPGYDDVNAFLASVDLSDMRIAAEQRKRLARKLVRELEASQRQTARTLGVALGTVNTDVRSEPNSGTSETESVRDAPDDERSELNAGAADDGAALGRDRTAMFTSLDPDWETPQELFDALDAEFHFDLDVCATDDSAKCTRYFTPEQDGLAQEWAGTCWMNPPYGAAIEAWVAKAAASAAAGATVVCLVPARVDTGWWWDHCLDGEIRFLRGRLRFGDGTGSAPFPSAVVVLGRPARVIWWKR